MNRSTVLSCLLTVAAVFLGCDPDQTSQGLHNGQSVQAAEVTVFDTSKVVPPPMPRKSPMAVARINLNQSYIKIVYGVPQKHGRVVFGALEPFGQVWRLGANETTELTTSRRITIGSLELEPGTYSLFAIPEPDKWTLIINSGLGQWGAYDYDETLDVGRINLPTRRTAKTYEGFTIWFGEASEDRADLNFAWDHTQATVNVRAR